MSMPEEYFRAGAGAVVINDRGLVLALERADIPGAWQLPQGGLDAGEEPLDAARLTALVARLGVPVRELMRSKEALYQELGLAAPERSDAELIAAIAEHPVLLNRPIVVTPKGARLCRPPELVRDLIA